MNKHTDKLIKSLEELTGKKVNLKEELEEAASVTLGKAVKLLTNLDCPIQSALFDPQTKLYYFIENEFTRVVKEADLVNWLTATKAFQTAETDQALDAAAVQLKKLERVLNKKDTINLI